MNQDQITNPNLIEKSVRKFFLELIIFISIVLVLRRKIPIRYEWWFNSIYEFNDGMYSNMYKYNRIFSFVCFQLVGLIIIHCLTSDVYYRTTNNIYIRSK
jgi:hypothetical protein